jgi:hypothetical protein
MRGKLLSGCIAVSMLAACGSSKSVSTGAPASTTAAGAATTKPVSTGAPTITTVGAATTVAATTPADSTPKLTGAADNEFCRYLVQLGKKPSSPDDLAVTGSPEELKQGIQELQTLYSHMVKRAPAEIKTELLALSADAERVAAIYASVGYDVAKLQELLADPASQASVEFSKLGASGADTEKIDAYIENVCGLKG